MADPKYFCAVAFEKGTTPSGDFQRDLNKLDVIDRIAFYSNEQHYCWDSRYAMAAEFTEIWAPQGYIVVVHES